MHELSIARRVRRTVETVLAADGAAAVTTVRVRVGVLSGVVPELLVSAWPHAVADSPPLADAALEVQRVPTIGWCPTCAIDQTVGDDPSLRCPVCDTPLVDLRGGDELEVASVDVRDA